MKNMIILSLREYNALLSEAYMKGREMGRAEGRQEFIRGHLTPNDIRKALGFEPCDPGDDNIAEIHECVNTIVSRQV